IPIRIVGIRCGATGQDGAAFPVRTAGSEPEVTNGTPAKVRKVVDAARTCLLELAHQRPLAFETRPAPGGTARTVGPDKITGGQSQVVDTISSVKEPVVKGVTVVVEFVTDRVGEIPALPFGDKIPTPA